MIKRFAGRALVAASALLINSALVSAAVAADAAPAAGAATVQVNPDHPDTYTVQPGDTLWGISEKFLKNPWQWPEVWHINEQVGNPHLIYPGDKLRLMWKDGQPSLVVDRGDSTAGIGSSNTITEVMADGKTVKLRPRMRELPLAASIPAIPLKNIEAFLVDSRVVTQEELKAAPYIIAGADKRVIMGGGDTAYARHQSGSWEQAFPEYGVFRQGTAYIDPITKELLGYEARRIGNTRIVDTAKDIATLRVLEANEEMRVEDRLLGTDQRKVQSVFYPRPAPDDVEGRIIHIFGSIGYGARNDVVAINKGERDKIEPGQVFAVMQKGETVRDRARGDLVELPAVNAGLIIVFRTFEKVSYALVTRSTGPLAQNDIVKAPRIDMQ